MRNIKFLLWGNDLNRGEDGNAFIAEFMKRACNLVELEINESGGIAGKPLSIDYLRVPKGVEGLDKLFQHLKSSPDVLFLNYHTMDNLNQQILETLNLDSYIYFSLLFVFN